MENEVNLKDFFKIIVLRKWWFIGTLIIVIIAGVLFNFLQKPIYSSESKIRLENSYIYYNDQIYNYFPEEAASLWIAPTYKYSDFEERNIIATFNNIQSEEIIDLIIKNTDLKIDKQILKESFLFSITDSGKAINIETFNEDPQTAYKINENLLVVFIPQQRKDFEEIYNNLIIKIESKLMEIEEELSELSEKAIESIATFNINYTNELEKNGFSNIKTEEIKFIDPILESEIDYKFTDYIILDSIKRNLIENKDFIINRIEVLKNPEISYERQNENNIRNLAITLISALIIAVVVSFLANYFITKKNN